MDGCFRLSLYYLAGIKMLFKIIWLAHAKMPCSLSKEICAILSLIC